MTRTSSISRRLIGDNIEVRVSTTSSDSGHDTMQGFSGVDGPVSFRIKPDRRLVDTIMPAGQDRRRF